jgi:uncharacterized membrane protein
MNFLRNQIRYLLAGFILWLPVGIIVVVGYYLFGTLEGVGEDFLGLFLQDRFVYPGLGIALWIMVFLLTGLALKKTRVGYLLSRIPIVGLLFRIGGETMTLEKLIDLSPCLFLYSPTCLSYGWILSEQEVKLNNDTAHFTLVNVYYPNVPTLVTGQVYTARKETVMKLGNQSREIVDILLYGLRRPVSLRYLPWDDEDNEEFKRRAELFGIALGADSTTDSALGSRQLVQV